MFSYGKEKKVTNTDTITRTAPHQHTYAHMSAHEVMSWCDCQHLIPTMQLLATVVVRTQTRKRRGISFEICKQRLI